MFDKKDFSQILEAMRHSLQEKSDTEFDFQEGSVVRTLFESFAYEMAVLYEQMERVYLSGYVDSAENTDLDKVVAILGIKRGEPEYAIGEVEFEKDEGLKDDIEIPIGLLVTTEDTEKFPKKAYRTIEGGIISSEETSVSVRVQGEQPGKEGETLANTIVIMPQPVPGVKLVNNPQEIKFTGREREEDKPLRDRAKETLLAASGSNSISLKNSLLSVPGVKDVKIKEDFTSQQFGVINVIVDTADWFKFKDNEKKLREKIDEVKAAGIYVLLRQPQPIYLDGTFLIELAPTLKPSPEERSKLEEEVQAEITDYIRNFPMGEDLAIAQLTKQILDINGINNIENYQLFTRKDYAEGEVTITSEKENLSSPLIIPTKTKLTVNHNDNKLEFETISEGILTNNNRSTNILIKSVIAGKKGELIAVKSNTNWEQITVNNIKLSIENDESIRCIIPSQNQRITIRELETITPGIIKIASEKKDLRIDIQMQIESLNAEKEEKIKNELEKYFNDLKESTNISKSTIKSLFDGNDNANNIKIDDIKLTPHFWHNSKTFDGETIDVSFVEKVVIGQVFLYEHILEIKGAVLLTFPVTITQKEKGHIYEQVRQKISQYLDDLQPEENVDINTLMQQVKTVNQVIKIKWRAEDFEAENITIMNEKEIKINQFYKAKLSDSFMINSDIIPVNINITSLGLIVSINSANFLSSSSLNIEEITLKNLTKESLTIIYKDLLQSSVAQKSSELKTGQSLNYEQFKNSLRIDIINVINNISSSNIDKILLSKQSESLTKNSLIEQLEDKDSKINDNYLKVIRQSLINANYTINNIILRKEKEQKDFTEDISMSIVEQAIIQPMKLTDEQLTIDIEGI